MVRFRQGEADMRRMLQGAAGVVMVMVASTSARADAVTDWNDMLFRAALVGRLSSSLADIAAHDSPASIASGRAWGKTVADAIWAWRLTDGFATTAPFPGNTAVGQWRQTPNDPYIGTSAAGIGYKQFSE